MKIEKVFMHHWECMCGFFWYKEQYSEEERCLRCGHRAHYIGTTEMEIPKEQSKPYCL